MKTDYETAVILTAMHTEAWCEANAAQIEFERASGHADADTLHALAVTYARHKAAALALRKVLVALNIPVYLGGRDEN